MHFEIWLLFTGHVGTDQAQCESSGCCWVPSKVSNKIETTKLVKSSFFCLSQDSSVPWCFYKLEDLPVYKVDSVATTALGVKVSHYCCLC